MSTQADHPMAWAIDWQRLWNLNGEPAEYAERIYRDFLRGADLFQTEAASYWNEAWQNYVEGMERLGKSGSPQEAMEVQADLANHAITRFWDESRKMNEILGSAMGSPFAPSGHASSRVHHRTKRHAAEVIETPVSMAGPAET